VLIVCRIVCFVCKLLVEGRAAPASVLVSDQLHNTLVALSSQQKDKYITVHAPLIQEWKYVVTGANASSLRLGLAAEQHDLHS
jgi:hypothetical protein